MKKFGLASLVFMLCLSCSIAFTPINVSAASVNVKPYDTTIETNIVLNHEDEVELAGFMKMQDKITNTLSLKDGKYIYITKKRLEKLFTNTTSMHITKNIIHHGQNNLSLILL